MPSTIETNKRTLPKVNTIFVWDFDWTITNCNSDEYIPSQFLGDNETTERFRVLLQQLGPSRWHECVEAQIDAAVKERGATRDDLLEAASSMPYLAGVRGSLGDVVDAKMPRCGQAIISDGNDWFINAFLRRNGMEHYFTHGIETNRGNWESSEGEGSPPVNSGTGRPSGCLRVIHQSEKFGGHKCERCPPNLCKTQVLNHILERVQVPNSDQDGGDLEHTARPRIVYVGDGSNDACPALKVLTERDVLLARGGRKPRDANSKRGMEADGNSVDEHEMESHEPSGFSILSTLQKAKKNHNLVPKCRVSVWRSGKELRSLIKEIISET